MNKAVYQNRKPSMGIAYFRAFNALEGCSVELSKIAESAMREAIKIRHSDFEEKLRQIERELLVLLAELEDESDYDEEFLKPSKTATDTTRNVLLQAYRGHTNFSLLPKFVTADGDGGIRVQWQNEAKELRLLCSDEGELKLYWQNGSEYGLEEPKITNLISRFKWLKEA